MKHRSISFLLALLLTTTAFFISANASTSVEGAHGTFGDSETTVIGEPPVSLTSTKVLIDVNAIPKNHIVLPTISVLLTPTLETALQFKIYDRNDKKALETILDETASNIHDPSEVPMESVGGVDANSSSPEPWLTSMADNEVMVCSAGTTTLVYTAIVPAHREGWSWTLVPERKLTVEIPVEIQESAPADIHENTATENNQRRLMVESNLTPEVASQVDSSVVVPTMSLLQQASPKENRTWKEWYDQLTPTEKDIVIGATIGAAACAIMGIYFIATADLVPSVVVYGGIMYLVNSPISGQRIAYLLYDMFVGGSIGAAAGWIYSMIP